MGRIGKTKPTTSGIGYFYGTDTYEISDSYYTDPSNLDDDGGKGDFAALALSLLSRSGLARPLYKFGAGPAQENNVGATVFFFSFYGKGGVAGIVGDVSGKGDFAAFFGDVSGKGVLAAYSGDVSGKGDVAAFFGEDKGQARLCCNYWRR